MKIGFGKSIKVSTAIALSTSLLMTAGTLVVAVYALIFFRNIFVYMLPQEELVKHVLLFKDSLQQIVLDFLIFGLILSYYLTKMIVRPLEQLLKGTKEIAKGNLDYRMRTTDYMEINELIKTYNQMAENLQSLYSDLDNKVKERTKELEDANNMLKETQMMIVHSEKMRSLGQLVAGITHEINNPINFVYGNMIHLKKYSNALIQIIDCYQEFENELSDDNVDKIKQLKEGFEFDFIKEDLPMLLKSCQDGTERTKNIILDLKSFSRLDEMVLNKINLEKEIDLTLNILNNKLKGRIEIFKEYEENIPEVEGYGGQLNQVFMNVLDNACYAIKNKGNIYIRLKKSEKYVIIEFEDTGCGMKKEQSERIFEPFYTTKTVGEGTGLGMSIGYKIIQNHCGSITVDSVLGKGTKFLIQLPLKMEKIVS